MDQRGYVLPEDIQAVLPYVAEHRLRGLSESGDLGGASLADRLLSEVDVTS
jgi:MoxR-like ATPase